MLEGFNNIEIQSIFESVKNNIIMAIIDRLKINGQMINQIIEIAAPEL